MAGFTLPHDHGEQKHAEKQLSDPTRVRIFWLLSHHEECVINIAAMLEMSSPAVSHHLRCLTQSGLLTSRRCGKEVYYKAADTAQIRLLHEIVEQVMEIPCSSRRRMIFPPSRRRSAMRARAASPPFSRRPTASCQRNTAAESSRAEHSRK